MLSWNPIGFALTLVGFVWVRNGGAPELVGLAQPKRRAAERASEAYVQ